MSMRHFYRTPGLSEASLPRLLSEVRQRVSDRVEEIRSEYCYNVAVTEPLTGEEERLLVWLLSETYAPRDFGTSSFLQGRGTLLEVGPRMSFTTAWSTNAVSVCRACGLGKIERIERSRRYLIESVQLTEQQRATFLELVHDRMTECAYGEPLESFVTGVLPAPVCSVPVLEQGRSALEAINAEMGLAFDDWDLDYYTALFRDDVGRNPTNVECFDIAQSNSEHSRHWFFKGRLIIDGKEAPKHLISMLQDPLDTNPENSVIAFKDNSSGIRGFHIQTLLPTVFGEPGAFILQERDYHIIFTAETHNFPSGVAPFPGAETGTGGRIRDVHATGKGSLVVAGTAAYCVGNLQIPGYDLPWEDASFQYPGNLASPLQIEIEASNGASDYGNKFGEPLIQGFTRSFGLRLRNGERREWIKPIMFSGGIGQIDARHTEKEPPEKEMWVVKLGGPAYRIGMGGGAASSMVQGENVAELDFNAVQRGDAEMEQKVSRVIRACVEMGDRNPIVSIHDQGAGGSCNVLKEIVDPQGARIDIRAIPVGDETLSVLEIWGAEYQEVDALLLRPEHADLFKSLCNREKILVAFVGKVTGDGQIQVFDSQDGSTPVDMSLDKVLGDMPQKVFELERRPMGTTPLELPSDITVKGCLERVLRLVSVGSKRFLTSKVDRSVTGLIAQQQCVGPLQLTVADVAVIAQSHFGVTGAATAIGERPIAALVDAAAMARMCVAESLTNLVWARTTGLQDVKCSGNWMWAAKLPGEGAAIHDAVEAVRALMLDLGIAIDGGKDSLSMAALAPDGSGGDETVKAPGTLVVSAYATCPDITGTVTPDLKLPGSGSVLLVDLANGRARLGGSSLAHVYGQVGNEVPDVEDISLLRQGFEITQKLLAEGLIASGHDRSDGGLITTLVEMAASGDTGLHAELPDSVDPVPYLFCEELGLVLEVAQENEDRVTAAYREAGVPCERIARTASDGQIHIQVGPQSVLDECVTDIRSLWEETSYQLDRLQTNPECVRQEWEGLARRGGPQFELPFAPCPTAPEILEARGKPRVAVVREEGSNGDREMASAFYAAGFEPWDVTMTDLLDGRAKLQEFRGIVFVGGFSYADVLDSAKGWAGVIRYNQGLWQQFQDFYNRPDTFSLGVCNGCQLMALLGWVPWGGSEDTRQPRFVHNTSGRFESRFSTVRIEPGPAMMLSGMAGASLGIWVAHGEGRAYFPDNSVLDQVLTRNLAPLRYVDNDNRVTQAYPYNPNGSPEGIAGLCSADGRHLAMMPHPERTFLKWQWGWMPPEWRHRLEASPWLRMFQNARTWCEETV
jgi:phosphoribosylformylglycinamidine synthase